MSETLNEEAMEPLEAPHVRSGEPCRGGRDDWIQMSETLNEEATEPLEAPHARSGESMPE